jgi:hypothetical protein
MITAISIARISTGFPERISEYRYNGKYEIKDPIKEITVPSFDLPAKYPHTMPDTIGVNNQSKKDNPMLSNAAAIANAINCIRFEDG